MSLTNDTTMIEKDVREIYEFEKNLSIVNTVFVFWKFLFSIFI